MSFIQRVFFSSDSVIAGARTLTFKKTIEHADKNWGDIHDAIIDGQSVATLEDIKI